MNCAPVRDRLAEHALGVMENGDLKQIERHLAWCAACRQESEGLRRAAGSLAYAVAPVEPPADLEDRIVGALGRTVRSVAPPRRGRPAVAAVIAAMLALTGLGWGAVMAGRAARSEKRVESISSEQTDGLDRFITVIKTYPTDAEASLANLVATEGRSGGAAATVSSVSTDDLAMVQVAGLDPAGLPYRVWLIGDRGMPDLRVGRIDELDADGIAELARTFVGSLEGYDRLVVADRRGRAVLEGVLMTFRVSPSVSPAPPIGH
jgi:Anti-sigma-K factor rskA/Putative zinc-finger